MRRSPRLLMDAGSYSLSGSGITGIGLRIAELAQTLAAEFPVRVLVDDVADCVPVGAARLVPAQDWPRVLDESDVVFFYDLPVRQRLEDAVRRGLVIVSENAPPLEHMEYPSVLGASDPVDVHRRMVAGFSRFAGDRAVVLLILISGTARLRYRRSSTRGRVLPPADAGVVPAL